MHHESYDNSYIEKDNVSLSNSHTEMCSYPITPALTTNPLHDLKQKKAKHSMNLTFFVLPSLESNQATFVDIAILDI